MLSNKFISKLYLAMVSIICIALIFIGTTPILKSSAEVSVKKNNTNAVFHLIRSGEDDGFYIENTQTGERWSAFPESEEAHDGQIINNAAKSILEIDYIFEKDKLSEPKKYTANSYVESVSKQDYEITETDNGFSVTYNFTDLGLHIPISFSIENGYLEASVQLDKIKEDGETLITGINLLPYFSAGSNTENGEIFVPDGCGALIHFNNNVDDIYSAEIYGSEPASPKELENYVGESINLPVFGLYSGNKGVLGVITEGVADTLILAQSGVTGGMQYNIVSSKYMLRSIYSKPMMGTKNYATRITENKDDKKAYTVRYYPISKESVSITDLADIYRNYLIEENGLKITESEPAFMLNLIGSVDIEANFLGIPYRKQISLTTYSEAIQIVEALSEKGIDNISLKYSGWMKYGVSNRGIVKKVNLSSVLGNKNELLALKSKLLELDGSLYPETDLVTFKRGFNSNSVKNAFRETAYQSVYMPSVYATRLDVPDWMLLTPEKLSKTASKYIKSYSKYGFENIALSGISNVPYSNLDGKNYSSQSDTISVFENIYSLYKKKGLDVSGDNAFDYAIPYLSRIDSAPANNSGYKIINERVPFYSIVLHGILPMSIAPLSSSSDITFDFLTAVENGYELAYTGIYSNSSKVKDSAYDCYFSTNYKLWIDEAIELYNSYYPLLRKIHNAGIIGYKKLSDNTNRVTYNNGISVYVNYGKTDEKFEELIVKAESFTYTEN